MSPDRACVDTRVDTPYRTLIAAVVQAPQFIVTMLKYKSGPYPVGLGHLRNPDLSSTPVVCFTVWQLLQLANSAHRYDPPNLKDDTC